MISEKLLRRYAAGERNFTGIGLHRADLSGVDLSAANFSTNMMVAAAIEYEIDFSDLRNDDFFT